MASVHEVIEAFRVAPSNAERGAKFEQLMVRYFELDPMLHAQYDRVWRWMDWPERQGADTGIDLVARERDTGELTAIQCKFYEPAHTLAKKDVDSFFTASGKKPFTNRIIISTTDRWGPNAESTLADQQIPVERISLADIADSPINWDIAWPGEKLKVTAEPAVQHEPRPHQQVAIEQVLDGFATHDRGKLIMACGTGKTFTTLKVAERWAEEHGGSARVLFVVPSISLLSQTMREWTAQSRIAMRSFAVCSDVKVSRVVEDIKPYDVPLPATTDAVKLVAQMDLGGRPAGLTVVFSTYQSLSVIAEAQQLGLDAFDLIVCDEAHRTTGVTLQDADESHFVKVHNNDYVRGTKRLYMTATPRIFDEKVKAKADEYSAEITSMDDKDTYGPEFHSLTFGTAVGQGLLTDYKVLVLTVDEEYIAGPLQEQVVDANHEINLDDATKIVGCWNGLAKRAGADMNGNGFPPGQAPMRRAVAFLRDIESSQRFSEAFEQVIDAYDGAEDDVLECSVHHVDGTFNALERNRELAWLKAPLPDGECRILSNARCLSEGVDVPALDAVMFLNPRNSVVDVVQSVGRVMRRAKGKDYGYIILPVGVPSGTAPEKALADNKRFKVVWQVLNALRAHDDRFNAMVNSIELNQGNKEPGATGNDQLMGGHIGPTNDADESLDTGEQASPDESTASRVATQAALFSLADWRDAIYARVVKNVGTKAYWEDWAQNVAEIAAAQQTRIRATVHGGDPSIRDAFATFTKALRNNLNDSITEDVAISMLSQHLITKPVFDALFEGYSFAAHNPVSQVMQAMVDTLSGHGFESETRELEGFYNQVRVRASGVTSASGKQTVITELYERFFKLAFKKQADSLGIVYTPVEIVDFLLRAANDVLVTEFGRTLSDQGVHVLDGFTGTGTFIVRLLQSGIIKAEDLARKYAIELHANEIMLLAYYIAAVNIEATYHGIAGGEYTPFDGIVLTDTFQISEAGDQSDTSLFPANNTRIEAQLATPIQVIVGNPPYSVGQTSANDNNANNGYPTLDGRIAVTYAARSIRTNKNSLYDSYIRAIRWATDRIGNEGVVAYVSNGGWIDSNAADGLRLSLAAEFSSLYIYNLRGNMKKPNWKAEGGQIFGAGSQATIAMIVAVKNDRRTGTCRIHYREIGDYLSRERKLEILDSEQLANIEWSPINPNKAGDWINHRNENFTTYPAIGDKNDKAAPSIFSSYSAGLQTNRDAWVYNFSDASLIRNVGRLIDNYNSLLSPFQERARLERIQRPDEKDVSRFLATTDAADERFVKWSRSLRSSLARGTELTIIKSHHMIGIYRPFVKQHSYFDRHLNHERSQLPSMFPTPNHPNIGIVVTAPASHYEFTPYIVDALPNLHVLDTAQFFPRWTYEKVPPSQNQPLGLDAVIDVDEWGYRRIDNVTDAALADYRASFGDQVTKNEIFYYTYGLLHSPHYRQMFAADLKKMLPRIPKVSTREDFEAFAEAGLMLADVHVNYETVEPYPLNEIIKGMWSHDDRELWRVVKMKWRSKSDRSAIVYNSHITLEGIPDEAHRYVLGPRTALDWLIDRYRVTTDKNSGIVNDPNDWCDDHDDTRYIIELIKRITTVSIETVKIVDALPELDLTGSGF
jgi:predicted helicase